MRDIDELDDNETNSALSRLTNALGLNWTADDGGDSA